MLNVYEQVTLNKQRSFVVVIGFILFVTSFIWVVGKFLGSSSNTIFFAAVFSLVSSISGYYWGDKVVLSISGARPTSKRDNPLYYSVVENISIATQLPMPKIFVIETPSLNAFATGRDPKHAIICATTGLLEKLNRSELEAVVAHEFSHVQNYDIRLMTVVAVLVGMVSLVTDLTLRWRLLGGSDDDRKDRNPLIIVVGIISLFIGPLIAKLIQLAISRRREFLADASAVKITRYPQGLIAALRILSLDNRPMKTANSATAHMFIVNPFLGVKKGFNRFSTLFSTHPPIEERIASLERML